MAIWDWFKRKPSTEKINALEKRLRGAKISESSEPEGYVIRHKEFLPKDKAFEAWTSGDLNLMIDAASTKTNSVDRHYLLQSIVTESYRLRKTGELHSKMCATYSEMHLVELPSLLADLLKEWDNELLRISTFQHYATLLTELKKYDRAIEVCEEAIKIGLHDGTKSGFAGRIIRIEKAKQRDMAK